ncbi:Colicin V production protein [Rubrivivax sp. A210]|uniref:CvpA family protein n=1 Tax=Rubrivivax sp. A210 TaxID=2772301 RepID=UPI0019C57C44|nr:CvpA family protein [Rubrivivax sp. A210]CAD5372395.1 Colicin V production protein [Rubrivivax sp. A210]
MGMGLPDLPWVDWALLAVLALSIVVGLVRGFVFECLSLAGWLVAWFGAQWVAPQLAPHLPLGAPGSSLNLAAAFALVFIAAMIVWGLLARLVRLLIHATPLSIPDRLLGAVFGLLRGGVLLLAVALVVALTPAAQSTAWRAAQGGRWLTATLLSLEPLLPEAVARRIRA